MKCKPYSEITVEIRTQLKTVKITSNIFAVWAGQWEKGVWADSEQLFWMVFSIFHGQKIR